MTELSVIIAGFLVLGWSADRFVQGASAIAINLRVSPLVIGLTIVALGTSAPEMIVSGMASWNGNSGLAIGNAIGSNIINTGLILGITALIVPLDVHSSIIRRELPVLLMVMVAAGLLLSDGSLDRTDGVLLLAGMLLMIVWTIRLATHPGARPDPVAAEFAGEMPTGIGMGHAILLLVAGIVLMLASSRLLVWAAVSVAQHLGISDLVIGLTIVALGTSLPELAASTVSALRGEHDIAIGNVVGSNIFNMLAVLGLPGLIGPGEIDAHVMSRDFPVMVALTMGLFVMAYGFRGRGRLNRPEGALLVCAFGAYQTLLYFAEVAHAG